MATLDGVAGADKLLAFGTYRAGLCLEAVSKALGSYYLTSDKPGWYTYALRGWQNTPANRKRSDRNPPKGAVVYFSASGNGYGHICLSLGGGRIASTDVPRNGVVGVTTIDALERAWNRTYLGWADWLMGHEVTVAAVAPPTPGVAAPAFPLPWTSYFGPKSGPAASVSGYFSHREDLRRWQKRMQDRGWNINPDGLYGDQTRDIAKSFQREKGLTPDGLIGPATWAAAWTAPIT